MTNAPEPFAHDNAVFGGYGEFIETPADHDWAAHDAEATAYFAELDAIKAADEDAYWQAEAEQAHHEADPEYQALYNPIEQGYYDDDPSPYNGDYSEW